MTGRAAVVVGVFVLLAAGLHAGLFTLLPRPAPRPLHTGHVAGDITYRIDANTTGVHKVDGCRVELYDTFVLVHIDKQKAPTWTDNYTLTIPWHRIENMTLQPE
jgi:hypothetical protein